MIQITFTGNRTAFAPGDTIAGEVQWSEAEPPTSAEVKLCWMTRGKGTEDSVVVISLPMHSLLANARKPFRFTAPESPYSFSGRLVSLIWTVECELQPGDRFERAEIVIAPDAKEVVLPNAVTAPALPNPIAAGQPVVR